jgi:hypothetical protein
MTASGCFFADETLVLVWKESSLKIGSSKEIYTHPENKYTLEK